MATDGEIVEESKSPVVGINTSWTRGERMDLSILGVSLIEKDEKIEKKCKWPRRRMKELCKRRENKSSFALKPKERGNPLSNRHIASRLDMKGHKEKILSLPKYISLGTWKVRDYLYGIKFSAPGVFSIGSIPILEKIIHDWDTSSTAFIYLIFTSMPSRCMFAMISGLPPISLDVSTLHTDNAT
ncbi:hypothetical protein HAX54_003166 [Datura stramonium]|uniref:Uncharacterized protein n=1 Tax=Datura stramonium TaxID=4076 RepID=A0ABS8T757_DATST|nr:hypothetical protein [Datura stramonium]